MKNRRDFIKGSILARKGLLLPRLSLGASENLPYFPSFTSSDLVCLAGLRPFRPQGFVVDKHRGQVSSKDIYKSYGHGGAGWTMAWGNAEVMANKIEKNSTGMDVAVLGSGVIGLTVAYELMCRGYQVTVYSHQFSHFSLSNNEDLNPSSMLTSDIAGGQWCPSYVNHGGRKDLLQDILLRSYFRYKNICYKTFKESGLIRQISFGDERFLDPTLFPITDYPQLFFGNQEKRYGLSSNKNLPKELNQFVRPKLLKEFPRPHLKGRIWGDVWQYDSFMAEVPSYMNSLMEEGKRRGISFKAIDSPIKSIKDFNELSESIIVSCLGMGSKEVFEPSNSKFRPVRGQLVLMTGESNYRNSHIDYCRMGSGYMFKRKDAVILGGTYDLGKDETNLSRSSYREIYQKNKRLYY